MSKVSKILSTEQCPYVTPKAEDPYCVPGLNHPFNRCCRLDVRNRFESTSSIKQEQSESGLNALLDHA